MSSFKIYLILGLAVLLIGVSFGCKNIFGPDEDGDGDGTELKFATNVEFLYERTEPFISTDYKDSHVYLNVHTTKSIEGWLGIQNAKMEKLTEKKFKHTVSKLPADVRLWAYIQDFGKEEEFVAKIIKVNGTELTDIQDDPWGNPNKVAYFTIKENGTIVP